MYRRNSSLLYNEDESLEEEEEKEQTQLFEDSAIAVGRSKGDLISTMKDRDLSI